jgi:hypothetical protein
MLINYLNVRPQTVKLLEGTIGNTLEDIGIGNDFLNRIPNCSENKSKNSQMGLSQIRKLLQIKGNNYQNQDTMY